MEAYDLIHIHSVCYSLFAPLFLKSRIIVTPWGSDLNFPNITRLLQRLLFVGLTLLPPMRCLKILAPVQIIAREDLHCQFRG